MKKVAAVVTMLIGAVLMLSGWWLSSPEHAASFGVSSDSWMRDFIAGVLVLLVGGIANAGLSRQ